MSRESTLHLAKQNFKFSSAHFLIFDENSAEMLHGHNYQVWADIQFQIQNEDSSKGYHVDFKVLKKIIKDLCDEWDEKVLLPEKHSDMKYNLSQNKKNFEINFRDRFYSLPCNETIWLPVTNTSAENLSKLFAEKLIEKIKAMHVRSLRLYVEETSGQSASYFIKLN
jgi:6-pyruvoyltetrahydropterin/6-carboxytetrahydropterin synthase